MRRSFLLLGLGTGSMLVVAAACMLRAGAPPGGVACGLGGAVVAWPEADALFQRDPAWIGADAAYSVDLGAGRVLWLFGDTFIAKSPARTRADSWFIRNTVAIQSGSYDPSQATASFAWRTTNGAATSFFPESGANWFWPLAGIRLPSRLVLFLLEEKQSGAGAFGFEAVRTKIVSVTNPDADPKSWALVDGNLPSFLFPIAFGAAVVQDGPYVYAFGDEEPGDHSVYVARFDAAALDAGDASQVQFWAGGAWTAPGASPPDVIFPSSSSLDNPPTEFSVHKRAVGDAGVGDAGVGDAGVGDAGAGDAGAGGDDGGLIVGNGGVDGGNDPWIAVHSVGFGATSIAVRTAPAPEGPWSPPCTVFTPPDSLTPNVIVYAAKAHPELLGGSFVATYATNSTDLPTLAANMNVYFPRFVRVP